MIQCWPPAIKHRFLFRSHCYHFLFPVVICMVAYSCRNSETDLGLNLRPDKGEFYSAESDTFTVLAYTVAEDSIKTDSLSTNLLGAMHDPEFGLSLSGIASEITITQSGLDFGVSPKVDSVLLYMRWDKSYQYGNTKSKQRLKLYTVNEKIEDAKSYYSNYKVALGTEIGNWTGTYNLNDSVSLKTGKTLSKKGPGLLIKLNKSFGESMAMADAYGSVEKFKEFLKGIAFLPQEAGLLPGEGSIIAADFFTGASQIVVYYNDTLNRQFFFNTSCENFNTYSVKHSNADLANQLSKPKQHYNKSYIQSLGGCKTKIEIPHLLNLVKNISGERIIINEAALVLTPYNGSVNSHYGLPVRLNLFQPELNTNQNKLIIDLLDYLDPVYGGYALYGGSYNSLTGSYTIRFTRHLQNVLDTYLISGENLNRGLFVTIPSDRPITPSRLILDNTRQANYKALKFRISYSKVKI